MRFQVLLLDGQPGGGVAARDQGGGDVVRALHGARLAQRQPFAVGLRVEAGFLQGSARAFRVASFNDEAHRPPPFHLVGAQLLDEAPLVDDADAGRQAVDLGEDVARHEDSDAVLGGQRLQQLAHIDHAGRVEAVGGLVEDDELGLVEERQGEPEPLAVALRERAGLA